MTDDSLLPFDLPSVQLKKVRAVFDVGPISSDAGLVRLPEAERRLSRAETLAGLTLCAGIALPPNRREHPA